MTFLGTLARKKELTARILGIQKALEQNPLASSLLSLEYNLREEYERILLNEELLWLQKSRAE